MNAMDEPRIVVTSVIRWRIAGSGAGDVPVARICAWSQQDLAALSIGEFPIYGPGPPGI
jgi:hypothetical protein